jgi:hypothetical protein
VIEIQPADDGDCVPKIMRSITDFNQVRLNTIILCFKDVHAEFETHLIPWVMSLAELLRSRKTVKNSIMLSGDFFDAEVSDNFVDMKVWDEKSRLLKIFNFTFEEINGLYKSSLEYIEREVVKSGNDPTKIGDWSKILVN